MISIFASSLGIAREASNVGRKKIPRYGFVAAFLISVASFAVVIALYHHKFISNPSFILLNKTIA